MSGYSLPVTCKAPTGMPLVDFSRVWLSYMNTAYCASTVHTVLIPWDLVNSTIRLSAGISPSAQDGFGLTSQLTGLDTSWGLILYRVRKTPSREYSSLNPGTTRRTEIVDFKGFYGYIGYIQTGTRTYIGTRKSLRHRY